MEVQGHTSFDTTVQQAKSSSSSAENIKLIKSRPTESKELMRGPSIPTSEVLCVADVSCADIPSRGFFVPAQSNRDKRADLRMPRVRNDPNACTFTRRGSITRRPPGDILIVDYTL